MREIAQAEAAVARAQETKQRLRLLLCDYRSLDRLEVLNFI
jgi:hypothetical protein